MRNLQVVSRMFSSTARARNVSMRDSLAEAGRGGTYPGSAGYGKQLNYQKAWCVEDGNLVWQKRGGRDSGPFFFSMALTAVGVIIPLSYIWSMSWPKKQE